MAFLSLNILHQTGRFYIALCKFPSPSPSSKLHASFSCSQNSTAVARRNNLLVAKSSTTHHQAGTETLRSQTRRVPGPGSSSSSESKHENADRSSVKNHVNLVVEEDIEKKFAQEKYTRKTLTLRRNRAKGRRNTAPSSESNNLTIKSSENIVGSSSVVNGKKGSQSKKVHSKVEMEKSGKEAKKNKANSAENKLRVALDMCSKRGDVVGAIQLYNSAVRDGIKLGQHHYTVLLYLCSSAALGVVQPGKSGRGSRTLGALESSGGSGSMVGREFVVDSDYAISNAENLVESYQSIENYDNVDSNSGNSSLVEAATDVLNGLNYLKKDDTNGSDFSNTKDYRIRVSEEVKKFALQKGFEIHEEMCAEKIPMNEATLTSVARMAMSMGNGDMAFDMVKQMKPLGINTRLRSYGPALTSFCNSGDIDKAFAVEKHMLEHGVYPEEPELEALLRVSVATGTSNKVYYLLHKLRTNVRKVSPSTADLIVKWFGSTAASKVGKIKWDQRLIGKAIEDRGGGWHGQGWLGRGKWIISHATVGTDGLCKSCGEKLAIIDLDLVETEKFAESVAFIATKREKGSTFQKFQKWLDYYGPFEAVVDAANVGLLTQRKFRPSKVNVVANGIRQKLPSKKWPLIVLHNRRLTGHKMDEPVNKAFVEKWRNADALYATPTGSNDDWYWLYAAIKFKCLIVTNDEMRDHTFQLLGNDFFPRWKERHQVRFSFSDAGPVFHMPPPCSIVIQESEKGHWHIPIESENDYEEERIWLCITRAKSHLEKQGSAMNPRGLQTLHRRNGNSSSVDEVDQESHKLNRGSCENTDAAPQENHRNLRNIFSESILLKHCNVLSEIEEAEKLGNCIIDFQI